MSLDGRIRQGLVQAADSVQPNVEGDLMQVVARSRRNRGVMWAAGAVAVAAVGAFLFLGGTDLFDSSGDQKPIPPASTNNGDPTVGPTPEQPDASPSEAVTAVPIELWYTKGETLYPDTSGFFVGDDSLTPEAALISLLRSVSEEATELGLATAVPSGTDFLGLEVSDQIATVDLSTDFASGGGSLSMRMRVGQVVYTLTQFDEIEGVLFEIDGEPTDSIGGEGIDVSSPQTRDDYEDLLPAITVTQPGIGWDFTSGDLIEGTANVFEANVSWRILDENGEEIASGFETASCGTGCRGDFKIKPEFSVDHEQEGTIEVLEYSAENGEPINVVSIPVTLLAE